MGNPGKWYRRKRAEKARRIALVAERFADEHDCPYCGDALLTDERKVAQEEAEEFGYCLVACMSNQSGCPCSWPEWSVSPTTFFDLHALFQRWSNEYSADRENARARREMQEV